MKLQKNFSYEPMNYLILYGLLKDPIKTLRFKQTGWIRPTNFVEKKIPDNLKKQDIFYMYHNHHNKYLKFLNIISEKILPLTYSTYLFILK